MTRREFVCEKCGARCVEYGEWDGTDTCGSCQFFKENPDLTEKEREDLRIELGYQDEFTPSSRLH